MIPTIFETFHIILANLNMGINYEITIPSNEIINYLDTDNKTLTTLLTANTYNLVTSAWFAPLKKAMMLHEKVDTLKIQINTARLHPAHSNKTTQYIACNLKCRVCKMSYSVSIKDKFIYF